MNCLSWNLEFQNNFSKLIAQTYVSPELGWILSHRKVAHFFHNRHFHPSNRACSAQGIVHGARKIVLAGEPDRGANRGINPAQLAAQFGF